MEAETSFGLTSDIAVDGIIVTTYGYDGADYCAPFPRPVFPRTKPIEDKVEPAVPSKNYFPGKGRLIFLTCIPCWSVLNQGMKHFPGFLKRKNFGLSSSGYATFQIS